MSLEQLKDALLALARDHTELTGIIVFVLGFAESLVLVSLFVPSTVLFLALGAIHSAAGGAFWPIWLAGATGAFLGDCLSFALGRWFKSDVVKVWPMSRYPELIPKGHALFERWGVMSLIGSKFVGGLRPFVPIAAGAMIMPWALFLIGSALSCLLWAGVFLSPGYGLRLIAP